MNILLFGSGECPDPGLVIKSKNGASLSSSACNNEAAVPLFQWHQAIPSPWFRIIYMYVIQ